MLARFCLLAFMPFCVGASTLSFSIAPDIVGAGDINDGIYGPLNPAHSGVVRLRLNLSGGGQAICSGAAISSTAILTAGHCLTNGSGAIDVTSVDVELFDFNLSTYSTNQNTTNFLVHPSWTGNLINDVDLAIVRVANALPVSTAIYQLFTSDPLNQVFDVAGHGRLGSNGAGYGASLGFRTGQNIWDGTFATMAANGVGGAPNRTDVLLSDFDNGTTQNNAWGAINAAFSNTGVAGGREASTAPGDSGGPSFINGYLAGVTSFGLRFNNPGIDVDESLNSSFGEFNGMTSVAAHADWITQSAELVPEPSTLLFTATALAALMRLRRSRGIRRQPR